MKSSHHLHLLPFFSLALFFSTSSLLASSKGSSSFVDVKDSLPSPQEKASYVPQISGTLRGKYEWQTNEKEGRYQVRTARMALTGKVLPVVGYKVEIDLSDKGHIRMLDAYSELAFSRDWKVRIGQMRVPFTIDAHRGPFEQYFANRSFIAKQVGNVRDVGASLRYDLPSAFPIILEGGLFNGSGLTNQEDFWRQGINFSAKARLLFPLGLTVSLSAQKTTPGGQSRIMMYDAAAFWEKGPLHLEAEYLYKHYADGAFPPVHCYEIFGDYAFPLNHRLFKRLDVLARYDYMGAHSDGYRYLNGKRDLAGSLIVNDAQRGRLTLGFTLSFDYDRLKSNIRLNFEKYFYDGKNGAPLPHISERDKLVLEFMTHF